MSRSSAIVIPLLVAAAWVGPALAQDRDKVLETVRKLESRLEQVDKFIRGLQNTEVGEKHEEEIAAQAEGIGHLRDTLTTAVSDFAEQLWAAEEALGGAEQDAAAARLQLQEMTQRAEHAEAELAAEREQLGELEEELHRLRQAVSSRNPDTPTTSGIFRVPGVEGGFQIHITGGEVTFHINGLDQPQVPTRTEGLPGGSNLHLRLPSVRDDALEEKASSDGPGPRPTLRIHSP